MKKAGIVTAAILAAMGIVLWLGGFFAGKPEVKPEQLPLTLDGVFGAPNTMQDVWPVWSVQVSWERKLPVYVDAYGPTTHLIQLANRPQLSDIQKYIPQPYYLKGKYTATAVFSIVQVGARQEPVEQNPPTKNE